MIEDKRRLRLQFIHNLCTGTVTDSAEAVRFEKVIRRFRRAAKKIEKDIEKPCASNSDKVCVRVAGKREPVLINMVPMTTATYCLN